MQGCTYAFRGVGCALAAQLRAREQTWRDKHATYIGANNDLATSSRYRPPSRPLRPLREAHHLSSDLQLRFHLTSNISHFPFRLPSPILHYFAVFAINAAIVTAESGTPFFVAVA